MPRTLPTMTLRSTRSTPPTRDPATRTTPDRDPPRAPRRRWLRIAGTTLATVVAAIVGLGAVGATTTAADPVVSAVDPSAAPFAAAGPHAVGIATLADVDGLPHLTHWYPAARAEDTGSAPDDAPVTYDQRLFVAGSVGRVAVGQVDGTARGDAPVADLPPPPLVVLAPGYGIAASSYAWLAEHLASHGFAVVAHEADETLASAMGDGLWQAAADRPAVLAATVAHLQDLARTGQARWDPTRIAVLGHSIGGHAALAVGGARLDAEAFSDRCAAGDPDAAWLCDVLAPNLDALAERAGVAGETLPLLAPPTDVDAVVALAGDAYLFDADGLAAMTTPVLAIGGRDDTGTPWRLGAGMAFASAGSADRVVVGLAGAEHLVFTGRCDRVRRATPFVPMDLCDDPDGQRATRHDVVAHVTTAFLLATLTGDDAARALLDAPVDLPTATIDTAGPGPTDTNETATSTAGTGDG